MSTARLTMAIYDLGCWGSGALIVERALAQVPGVTWAYANSATEMAYIVYDPALTGPAQLIAAVERVGFHAGDPTMR
jgi:copper chaperone CopZ